MNKTYLWLILGIVCLVAGIFLVAEFVVQFAKLILGIILIVLGLLFISFNRGSARIIVR